MEEIRATRDGRGTGGRLPRLAAAGLRRRPHQPDAVRAAAARAPRAGGAGALRRGVPRLPRRRRRVPERRGRASSREEELEALAAVSIAVVEGLGIQRALDPDGFDHAARVAHVARRRRQLPRAAGPLVGAASTSAASAPHRRRRSRCSERLHRCPRSRRTAGCAATTAALTPPVNDESAAPTPPAVVAKRRRREPEHGA